MTASPTTTTMLAVILALLLAADPAPAATYVVAPDGSGDHPTIQAAVEAAAWTGDSIMLLPGTFSGPGNRDVQTFGKSIAIFSKAGDPASVTIACGGSAGEPHRFLHIQGEVDGATTVEAVTIVGGHSGGSRIPGGGGMLITGGSSAHIVRCVFEDNHAAMSWDNAGGAVYVDNGCNPTFTACEFRGNSGYFGGAVAVNHFSNATFEDCLFADNVGGRGGAIWGNSTTKLQCVLIGNSAEQGGAIWGNGYNDEVSIACTYALNDATLGSAIYAQTGYGSPVVLQNTIIAFGSQGAAVWAADGVPLQIACTDIVGNLDGDWVGNLAGFAGNDGNYAADPCFCDLEAYDVGLCGDSVCLPAYNPAGCEETVGARGAECPDCECGVVAVEQRSWSAVKEIFGR